MSEQLRERQVVTKAPVFKERAGETWYEVALKMKSLIEDKEELEGLVWRLGDSAGEVLEELLYVLGEYEEKRDALKEKAQVAVDKMGAYEARVKFIRKEIARVMSESEVDEFNCGTRRTTMVPARQSMEVVDGDLIPKEYLRHQKPKPNKKAAMEWYKDKGTVIAGFALGEGRPSVKVEWEVRAPEVPSGAPEVEGSEEG